MIEIQGKQSKLNLIIFFVLSLTDFVEIQNQSRELGSVLSLSRHFFIQKEATDIALLNGQIDCRFGGVPLLGKFYFFILPKIKKFTTRFSLQL